MKMTQKNTENLLVTKRTDVMVGRAVIELAPGRHLVPEDIADRVVASGCGDRLKERGKRLGQRGEPDGSGN